MKFTIGIITSPDANGKIPKHLSVVFNSIALNECYDDLEIIVVGGNENKTWENYKFIAFDETVKKGWITKKKNLITQNAQYENIVYMHDYIILGDNWFKGFEMFGDNFDFCMTPIKNLDGSRYRDWTLWPDDLTNILGPWDSNYLLPYEIIHLTKYMYFSGAYWIAKKSLMEQYPLNEDLTWGESEDVEWSKKVRENHTFSINTNSYVQLLKQKDRVFNEITPESLAKLNKII
jgi:hypothetical protein